MPESKIIEVKIKPGAKENEIEKIAETYYEARIKAPAHEGRANKLLLRLMAEYLGIARGKIAIKTGKNSRKKLLIISE